ncbi:MAG: hypothetical protein U0271_17435 [Polyangiaceae bacterium]
MQRRPHARILAGLAPLLLVSCQPAVVMNTPAPCPSAHEAAPVERSRCGGAAVFGPTAMAALVADAYSAKPETRAANLQCAAELAGAIQPSRSAIPTYFDVGGDVTAVQVGRDLYRITLSGPTGPMLEFFPEAGILESVGAVFLLDRFEWGKRWRVDFKQDPPAMMEFGGGLVADGQGSLYLSTPECGWTQLDIATGDIVGGLAGQHEDECNVVPLEDSFITKDGHYLVSPLGLWNLEEQAPICRLDGYGHVVSGDGRLVAYMEWEHPPRTPEQTILTKYRLVLRELSTCKLLGATAYDLSMPPTEPLSFGRAPVSVTVAGYYPRTFLAPKLAETHKCGVNGVGLCTPDEDAIDANAAPSRVVLGSPPLSSLSTSILAVTCQAGDWLFPAGSCP